MFTRIVFSCCINPLVLCSDLLCLLCGLLFEVYFVSYEYCYSSFDFFPPPPPTLDFYPFLTHPLPPANPSRQGLLHLFLSCRSSRLSPYHAGLSSKVVVSLGPLGLPISPVPTLWPIILFPSQLLALSVVVSSRAFLVSSLAFRQRCEPKRAGRRPDHANGHRH